MESGLKHENKFTWPFIPRNYHRRFHLNMIVLFFFFFAPLSVIIMDFTSYIFVTTNFRIEYNFPGFSKAFFLNLAAQIVGVYMSTPIMVVMLVFFYKYTKYAITTEGIYKSKWLKTRFANEAIFFPWDKIKFIEVRKTAFCWFAWKWTAAIHLRGTGRIRDSLGLNGFKIGLNDERLQEFLGVIQQCAPESTWQKTQESYNKNK